MKPSPYLLFAQYMLLLPGAILCLLPLEKHFRYPRGRLYGIAVLCITAISALCALLSLHGSWIDPNLFGLAAAVVALLCLFRITDLSKAKIINVLVNASAFFCFTGFAAYMVESYVNPTGTYTDVTVYGVMTQWVELLLLLLSTWRILRKQYAWLVSDYNEGNIWRISWLIPALIAACNLMMIPLDYSTLHVGRIFQVTLVIEAVQLILLICFNLIFYRMARHSAEHAALVQRANLMEVQASQYQKLKAHMEQTAQQRHDFRHSIRVMDELAKQGDLTQLRLYAKEYTDKLDDSVLPNYCANPALNALLGYYAAIALRDGVRTQLQIVLPKELPVAETDLCSLMGNLMENAIDACRLLPESERRIALSAEMQGERVYIVSTNAFDGNLRVRGEQYLSTKHTGSGMGLASVSAVVERYSGHLQIHHTDKQFCVDVCLKGRG